MSQNLDLIKEDRLPVAYERVLTCVSWKTCKSKQRGTTPIRMAKIQNTDAAKCLEVYRARVTLIHCWWECRTVKLSIKSSFQISSVCVSI